MNGYSTVHIAAMVRISSLQPKSKDDNRHFASRGSTGIIAIFSPVSVSRHCTSRAPNEINGVKDFNEINKVNEVKGSRE